jgi:hypothetical protein
VAAAGVGEHGGGQPVAAGIGGEPDRVRAGSPGAAQRIRPHLPEPRRLRRPLHHHRHRRRHPSHRKDQHLARSAPAILHHARVNLEYLICQSLWCQYNCMYEQCFCKFPQYVVCVSVKLSSHSTRSKRNLLVVIVERFDG